jgi:outer membrane biogenesis lipoprotein LolB
MILLTLLMSACATIERHEAVSSIGPYQNFTGRLIVIEPTRRWQAIIHWDGQPDKGQIRLTHAASNRIVLVSWEGERIRMIDNQNPADGWKLIDNRQLQSTGIILPPQQLAMILNGTVPHFLKEQKPNLWRGKTNGTLVLLKWIDTRKRLEITDMTHGRKAILMIQP